jgi:ribonuclease Z
MRKFFWTICLFAAAGVCAAPAQAADIQTPDIRITLLGTGGPELTPSRLGESTLVQAGGQMLLFDTGRGTLQRLYESRAHITGITNVFFTHLHSDHIEGLPELWMTGWFLLGRNHPLHLYGPVGTQQMADGMLQMYAHDVSVRKGASPVENMRHIDVTEFAAGTVYESDPGKDDDVRVLAFSVEHEDGNPAFGFRVEYHGHAVVLSGDTTYTQTLVDAARGADVVIQNVIAGSDAYLAAAPAKRAVMTKLTTPEQAARIFQQAKPRLAVYSHIIEMDVTDAGLMQRTRSAGYAGWLVVGQDRMVIDVGQSIAVHPPASIANLKPITKPGQD